MNETLCRTWTAAAYLTCSQQRAVYVLSVASSILRSRSIPTLSYPLPCQPFQELSWQKWMLFCFKCYSFQLKRPNFLNFLHISTRLPGSWVDLVQRWHGVRSILWPSQIWNFPQWKNSHTAHLQVCYLIHTRQIIHWILGFNTLNDTQINAFIVLVVNTKWL